MILMKKNIDLYLHFQHRTIAFHCYSIVQHEVLISLLTPFYIKNRGTVTTTIPLFLMSIVQHESAYLPL